MTEESKHDSRCTKHLGVEGRIAIALPILVLIGVMGPYLPGHSGVRTEQIVLYASAFLVIALLLLKGTYILTVQILWGIAWLLLLSVSLYATVMRGDMSAVRAGLDDFAVPLAVAVVMSYVLSYCRVDPQSSTHVVAFLCDAVVVTISLNTFIQVGQVAFGWSKYLGAFWSSSQGWSVAANSMSMGRYTGVFNQPIEVGVAVSAALLMLLLARALRGHHSKDAYPLALLILGGVLAMTKVVLVGVASIAVVSMTHRRPGFRKRQLLSWPRMAALLGAVSLSTIALIIWWHHNSASLQGYLALYSAFQGDWLLSLTAGRIGPGAIGASFDGVKMVSAISAIYGAGFGFIDAVDSSYLWAYMVGGLVGLVLYVLAWLVLVICLNRAARRSGRVTVMRMALAWGLLVLIGGIGAPVLTINRASTVLWITYWLIYASARLDTSSGCSDVPRPQRSRVGLGCDGERATRCQSRRRGEQAMLLGAERDDETSEET